MSWSNENKSERTRACITVNEAWQILGNYLVLIFIDAFLLKAERLELCLVLLEPWAKELQHLQWMMNINKVEEQL